MRGRMTSPFRQHRRQRVQHVVDAAELHNSAVGSSEPLLMPSFASSALTAAIFA
jgi:hypothetical protein